jgi:PAS domain S-box-containing protein
VDVTRRVVGACTRRASEPDRTYFSLSTTFSDRATLTRGTLVARDEGQRDDPVDPAGDARARLDALLRASPVAMALTTLADGRYLEVSAKLAELVGYRPEEMIGRVLDLGLWPSAADRQAFAGALFAEGEAKAFVRMRRRDGALRELEVVAKTVDVGGTPCVLSVATDVTDQRREDEARRLLEERLQAVVRTLPIALWFFDRDGVISISEGTAFSRSGFDLPSLVGASVWSWAEGWTFVDVEQGPKPLVEGLRRAYAGEVVRGFIGAPANLEVTYRPLRDLDGAITGVLGIALDVTERAVAEAALRTREFTHRSLVDSNVLGVIGWASDGRLLEANDAFLRIVGYSREDLLEDRVNWLAMTPEEFRDLDARAMEEIAKTGSCRPFEKEYVRKDGSRASVAVAGAAIDADQGIAFILDLSQQKLTAQALVETTKTLGTLIDVAPVGIQVLDPSGAVRLWNPACERIFGWRAREIVGRPSPFPVVSGASTARVELPKKDGGCVLVSSSRAPIHDTVGNVAGTIEVLVDLTEQRLLEEQLLHAQKMEAIGRLAGGIAHDFNNVLAVIGGFAGVAREQLQEQDPARQDLAQVLAAVERAAVLTKQLLAFGRRQVLAPRVLDPNELVAALEPILRRIIGEDVTLRTKLSPGIGRVKVDPAQLEQVLLNLVVNARDAMPTGGTLRIEIAEDRPGFVALSVTDDGIGMDAATRQRIFEPFFTTKDRGKGTGLGLASVYGIVEQSGGRVRVDSALGAGTTMTIVLPTTDEIVATPTPRPSPEGALRGHETILVVEDEDPVRALIQTILRRAGYTVLEAANAGEALLVCEQHEGPIDLVLTDVVMPRMNGPQLAERLRRVRPGLEVAFVSGYDDGALDLPVLPLAKPFTPDALLLYVRERLAPSRRDPGS